MLTPQDVADYFLCQVDEDAGDNISNLKLQKLLYYAQGFHLALFNVPLFANPVHAWEHGPVVPDIYHKYKQFGANAIPAPSQVDFAKFSKQDKELLNEVFKVFGQFSAWKLREMTHVEPPWKTTKMGSVIPRKELAKYFKTRVVND